MQKLYVAQKNSNKHLCGQKVGQLTEMDYNWSKGKGCLRGYKQS